MPNIFQQAVYKHQEVLDYQNNPLIEALPDIKSYDEVIKELANYPDFDESERTLPSHIRIHNIQRIFNYFQPLISHLDLESRLSRLLRQGYSYRNPFSRDFVEILSSKKGKEFDNLVSINGASNFRSTTSSITMIGLSGLGKTIAVQRIMQQYPQVIIHQKYKGKRFTTKQLVWLKLDCPHDGSLKSLCISFFQNVDLLLDTNYFEKYGSGRLSLSSLVPIMAQVAQTVSLGVLIVDEIQNASLSKSGGSEQMLNFFVSLINTIGVPVMLIGTPAAMAILQSKFRQARRGSGQGDLVWDRIHNDESWELFLSGMWKYQWTNEYVELNKEFIDFFYEKSQGIVDIAVKLFAMSQVQTIMNEDDKISLEIVDEVEKEKFKLVQPMLKALSTNKIKDISKFEDLYIPDYSQKYTGCFNSNIITSFSENNLQQEKINTTIKKSTKKIKNTKDINFSKDDIRQIVSNGYGKNLSAYESLRDSGLICDIVDLKKFGIEL